MEVHNLLNKDNPIPLMIQLKNAIEKQIIDGIYEDQLPSERELMRQYDVSRSTVREAINALVREGVLVKKHGKGTYVSIKSLDSWLGQLSSTTEVIRNLGMKPGAKLIDFKKVAPSQAIQKRTGFKEAYLLKRLRLADGEPIGVEQQYYPLYIGEQLEAYKLEDVTLYDVIQQELGIPFLEANQKISSGGISEQDREYLEVDKTVHILKAERIIKGQNESIIEYEEAFYRGDIYAFELNLSRKFG